MSGVVVLGMHRSGTSLVTRLVNLLGVPLGVEADLVVPTADNPRGYWESRALGAYNDGLLAALGCNWTCPPPLAPGWEAEPQFEIVRREAAGVFARVFPTDEWVWKDPRTCLTLPFWLRSLDLRPAVIVVHRNPLEIAASLGARDGLGRPYALALWERYARHALAHVSGLPVLVAAYLDVLADPLGWCAHARDFLARAGLSTSPPSEHDVVSFVDAGLRRARSTDVDLAGAPELTAAQRVLATVLGELSGAHGRFSPPELVAETPSTEALLAERRRAYLLERDLRRQYEELEDYARMLGERLILAEGRG